MLLTLQYECKTEVFFVIVIVGRTLIIGLETSKCDLSTKALLIQSK